MNNQWETIALRYEELTQKLSGSNVDPKQRHVLQKEQARLKEVLDQHQQVESLEKEIAEVSRQQAESSDPQMSELFSLELQDLLAKYTEAQTELDDIMYPPNPYDKRSVFVEIRAGTGGQEAALFAADLLKMYTQYALAKGWTAQVSDMTQTDLKGIKDVVLAIEGKNVYGHLKYDSGVHRVQRVPATETSGRIHTSTATVAVLPETDEVEFDISPDQLRIDVFRASGAGGQHVNTTDSAVRITHLPTGVAVSCQDERSQLKNKNKALKMLRSRLIASHQEKQTAELSEHRKELIGRGMRSEKVRTYNYPQNRITDHQIDLTLKKLDVIMLGDLDDIVLAHREFERQERRKKPFVAA